MAVTTTNIPIVPSIFGYSTLEGDLIQRSNAPRGEVVFSTNNAAVTVAGSGDTQLLALTMVLPQNYAYVLVDLFLELQALDQTDWERDALCVINATEMQALKFNLTAQGISTFTSGGIQSLSYHPHELPKALLRPVGSGTSMSINVRNMVIDGLASGVTTYARFLQFDIAQHHNVAVNTPLLTR